MDKHKKRIDQGTEDGSGKGGGEARHVHSGRSGPHAAQETGQAQAWREGGGLLGLFHRMGRGGRRGK